MITHIKIQNFRSFLEAEVELQPFSLVVGANGSGKSNLLRVIELTFGKIDSPGFRFTWGDWMPHLSHSLEPRGFKFLTDEGKSHAGNFDIKTNQAFFGKDDLPLGGIVFKLDAEKIAGVEQIIPGPEIAGNGSGTVQVLDTLKNGDLEYLFDQIEAELKRCVPEVEKLSLRTVKEGFKEIQVREKGLPQPLPATELSEGTRVILALLTIIHQESPPSMILLEDIDRGLHPRLFEYMAPLLRDIAIRHDINIVATTHNPYLVDAMQDHKDAVIIVEKKDGASTLSTLASRLEGLDYDKVDPDDLPLGQLWFSGLVGGVPARLSSGAAK